MPGRVRYVLQRLIIKKSLASLGVLFDENNDKSRLGAAHHLDLNLNNKKREPDGSLLFYGGQINVFYAPRPPSLSLSL